MKTTDMTNFFALQEEVNKRFQLPSDFQLQIENENGERINVDCDQDLEDNKQLTHTFWVKEVGVFFKSLLHL